MARDQHCAYPGCTRKPAWREARHVRQYDRDASPTNIDNLALSCSHHHKLLHSAGWSAALVLRRRSVASG